MKKASMFNFSVLTVVLAAWLLFSVVYIVMDLWRDGLKLSNQFGYERAYVEVIQRSGACEPFKVFAGEVSVDLINMKCLQPAGGEAEAAVSEGAAMEADTAQ